MEPEDKFASTAHTLGQYILDQAPEVGDQFIVRVLEKSPGVRPGLHVYIRCDGKDCETTDFKLTYHHGTERL